VATAVRGARAAEGVPAGRARVVQAVAASAAEDVAVTAARAGLTSAAAVPAARAEKDRVVRVMVRAALAAVRAAAPSVGAGRRRVEQAVSDRRSLMRRVQGDPAHKLLRYRYSACTAVSREGPAHRHRRGVAARRLSRRADGPAP
jgi:hypothetical protein